MVNTFGDMYKPIKKNSGTGHFCDKKQTNQHIAMKFEIHTIQPIIQVMNQSYYPTLKITEMLAIWKKVVKAWNHVLIDKKYTFFKF